MSEMTLESLLAHKPPMLMLDTLVSVDVEGSCCEITVSEKMPFADSQGNLPGWVGIELMAQTIAVWGGWQSSNEGRGVTIGLLLGSRKYESQVKFFQKGLRLVINAQKVIRDGNLGVFMCSISCQGETLATAQVSTYLPGQEELKTILEKQIEG